MDDLAYAETDCCGIVLRSGVIYGVMMENMKSLWRSAIVLLIEKVYCRRITTVYQNIEGSVILDFVCILMNFKLSNWTLIRLHWNLHSLLPCPPNDSYIKININSLWRFPRQSAYVWWPSQSLECIKESSYRRPPSRSCSPSAGSRRASSRRRSDAGSGLRRPWRCRGRCQGFGIGVCQRRTKRTRLLWRLLRSTPLRLALRWGCPISRMTVLSCRWCTSRP